MQFWSSRQTVVAYRPDLVLVYGPSTFSADFSGSGTLTAAVQGVATGLTFRAKADADALVPGPGIVSTIGIATTLTGTTVFIPPTASPTQYAWRGASGFAPGPSGSTSVWAPNSRYSYGWDAPPVWGIEFILTGTQVELAYQAANAVYSCFRIKIDGQRVSDLPVMTSSLPVAPTGGQRFMLKLTFATSATRRITIEGGYLPFGGMYTPVGSTVSAPPPFNTRLIVQGDSIVASSAQTTGLGNGTWVQRFANYVGADDPWNVGVGGTGFLNATPVTFINRMADLDHAPKAIIYFGGVNDRTANMDSLQAAAKAVFDAGLAQQPQAEQYVWGCWAQTFPAQTATVNVDERLRLAAAQSGLPFASTVTGNCYNAAGTLIDTYEPLVRNSTDVANFVGTDALHPTDAGNVRIAEWGREVTLIMSGTLTGTPYNAGFSGSGTLTAQVVSSFPPTVPANRVVKSLETFAINASTTGAPEVWEIEQTAGSTVPINGGVGSWSVQAPVTWGGTALTFRVRYMQGGVYSDWASVTFTVKQHEWWVKEAAIDVPYSFTPPAPAPVSPTSGLFFAMPTTYTGPKLYMAHFYPPYPRRISNVPADGVDLASSDYYARNYLNPVPLTVAEQGSIPYGGELRTRPMPLTVVANGLWEADNARRELQDARDAGLDGFFCNITNISGTNLLRCQQLRDVAVAEFPGFIVTPMLDTSSASALSSAAPAAVAALIAQFANLPCTKYLADGRMLIGSFQGDTQTTSWWTTLQGLLSSTYSITIAVCGSYNSFQTAAEAHKTVLYAAGQWGYGADPNVQNTSTGLATEKAYAAARGLLDMRSIWMQDIRPFASVFDEARNTEALIAAWTKAIQDDVPIIQLCTWSDLKEGSAFYRTESRGRVGADISAWYASWWKTGTPPAVLRDAAYLTHRQAPLSAVPTGPQTRTMQQWVPPIAGGRNNVSALREMVEARVFLTAPATVRITSNGSSQDFAAPAGMSAHLKAAGLGAVKVEVIRGTVTVINLASPIVISNSWPNDHREYAAFGSIRGTGGQRASWPRFADTPTAPTNTTPWLPFEMPSTETLLAAAATRNITVTTHPMGGFWVTPQQPSSDTVADYWDLNWLYNPAANRVATGVSASGTTLTHTATFVANGNVLFFTNVGGATGITVNTVYYVINKATNTFQLSLTSGGTTPITIGTGSGMSFTLSTLRNLYGGEARDRYARRPNRTSPSGTWQVEDIEWEIDCAQAAGINGFTWGTSTRSGAEWDRLRYALKAASNHNAANPTKPFYILPWILSLSSITGVTGETPTVAAQTLADLFSGLIKDPAYSGGFQTRNGRTLFMPYGPNSAPNGAGTTTTSVQFYNALDARMTANGTPADWYMVFQSSWQSYTDSFEPVSAAMGHFGSRDYNTTLGENSSYRQTRTWLQTTKAYTYRNAASPPMPYIAPISNQAFVPRGTPSQVGGNGIMWEAGGTQNLINSCISAIDQYNSAGWNVVNLNTWNDFAEGSHLCPSQRNGFNWLDLWSWYAVRMITGSYPTIVRDGIYLTHRPQMVTGVSYTSVQKKFVVAAGTPGTGGTYTGTSWVNILDVTVFLTSPATVEVTSGSNAMVSFSLPAGRNRVQVPMVPGTQSARIVRAGVTVVLYTSPLTVSNTQLVQDLTYVPGGSYRRDNPGPIPVAAN
jgi:lysophospholipase L1-like esterase